MLIFTGRKTLKKERKRILTHPLFPNLPPIPVLTESTAIFLEIPTNDLMMKNLLANTYLTNGT